MKLYIQTARFKHQILQSDHLVYLGKSKLARFDYNAFDIPKIHSSIDQFAFPETAGSTKMTKMNIPIVGQWIGCQKNIQIYESLV